MVEEFEKFYRGKNVLITGGLGFLGSNLAHALVDAGANVLLVDSLIPVYGGNLFNIADIRDKVRVNIADIRSEHTMQALVKEQEIIFNIAGQVSHIDSMTDPFPDLEINCRAQLFLLEALRHHGLPNVKIIFAGTRQVYGKAVYLPMDEKHILQPTDVNGINKMAGEWYHILYNNVYGIHACSLRLTNTFGPRQLMKHNRQGVIPWFIRQVIEQKKIQLWEGTQLRDINYVDDVIDAFLRAGASDRSNGQVYNLGHHRPLSLKDFVQTLIEVNGSGEFEVTPFPPEKKIIDVGDTYCSYFKMKSDLGWEPRTDLKDGIRKTLEYYKKYRQHYW